MPKKKGMLIEKRVCPNCGIEMEPLIFPLLPEAGLAQPPPVLPKPLTPIYRCPKCGKVEVP